MSIRDSKYAPPVIRWLIVIIGIGALELAVQKGWVDDFVIAAPSSLVVHLLDVAFVSELLRHGLQTGKAAALAFVAASITGILLGFVLFKLPRLFNAVELYVQSYYAVPIFVLYPVAVLFLGISVWSIFLIAFAWAVGAMISETVLALQAVDSSLVKYARSIGLKPVRVATKVQFPAAIPGIINGLKLCLVYSIAGVVGSEFILSTQGVGRLISDHYNSFRTEEMYASIVLLVVAVLLVHIALYTIERRVRARRGLT